MLGVGGENPFEMSSAPYTDPVEAFDPHGITQRSAKALAFGARIGVRITVSLSVRKTAFQCLQWDRDW
jgi:hypothetical protein